MNRNGFQEATPIVDGGQNMKKRTSENQTVPPTFPNGIADGIWELIALKAYQLYEQRGREEGHALEDWLKAEAMIKDEVLT